MGIARARGHFARHLLGWTCTGSALLGAATGLALSVLLLDRFSLETPDYVQRSALPGEGQAELPLASGLLAQNLSDGEDQADTDLAAADESAGTAEAEGAEAAPLQNARPDLVLADGQRVIGVDFDLGAARDRSNDIEITKPIHLNGQALGMANLAIDQQSRLHVSSEDLSNLLPEDLFARIDNGANYIDFDDLRAGGLDISYDPLTDVIEIVS